jgi:Putative death-receptor fusion protein (DUF2428)
MLIAAILVAESDIKSFDLTKTALSQLLLLSEIPIDSSGMQGIEPAKWGLPQVHAQNAMRAIFNESKLAQTTFGYIESGFAVSINGFSSDMYSPPKMCQLMIAFQLGIAVLCYSILYCLAHWDKNTQDKTLIHLHRINPSPVKYSFPNSLNFTNIYWINLLVTYPFSKITRYAAPNSFCSFVGCCEYWIISYFDIDFTS